MTTGTDLPATTGASAHVKGRLLTIAGVAAGVDLVTKALASWLVPWDGIDLPGPLDLQLAHNPGVAFGIGGRAPTWVVLAATFALVALLATAAWRGTFASVLGAGLVLGGAVANLADRLQAGTVVDMLHLGWWPTFNLADVWIACGAALLVLGEMRNTRVHGPT